MGHSIAKALALSILCAGPASGALAQGNQDARASLTPSSDYTFRTIAQSGARSDRIKQTLLGIKLPEGFTITLYAMVPGARHMAVGPGGRVTFVGTRGDKVWAITDRNGDGIADEVKDLAPWLDFTMPNGVCFSTAGDLYVAEQNRVLRFPDAEAMAASPQLAAFEVVKRGELIPRAFEARNHSARVCAFGPDGKLYISLGQPFNVTPKENLEAYDKWGIGGIIRLNADGSGRQVYTLGIRNSVGHAFNPANGELWFTDNQVDGMGDDIPPGELNRQTAMGQNFGFPWYGGGAVRTNEYLDETPPGDVVMPAVEFIAHAADLGMMFYTGTQFPALYAGGIFHAQHGSWDRTVPTGAQVMFTAVGADGSAGKSVVFASGWIDGNGEYLGRPVDVAQLADGSILVSDDRAGAIYRIAYGK
ncbi:L-sorbosone dehydrogenase [hydrothermal vent metagenome]|uniref:L-sorbosone dehydrogenase n=1 Tax=hydrothermal vent metagenome TaxID=652676 RepID=A0A3B0TT52_9ZZZZ